MEFPSTPGNEVELKNKSTDISFGIAETNSHSRFSLNLISTPNDTQEEHHKGWSWQGMIIGSRRNFHFLMVLGIILVILVKIKYCTFKRVAVGAYLICQKEPRLVSNSEYRSSMRWLVTFIVQEQIKYSFQETKVGGRRMVNISAESFILRCR